MVYEAQNNLKNKFAAYIIFSGIAALVNFGSRFLFDSIPHVNFLLAVTLAYLTGMIVNFILSKLFVFNSAKSGRTKQEALKFLFVASLGLIVTLVVSEITLQLIHNFSLISYLPKQIIEFINPVEAEPMLAHLTGMAIGLVANFTGHELLSFKETGIWNKLSQQIRSKSNEE